MIREAKGLAIFTTMRTGLWVSGAGGSGILVGRKDDGSWSPPSGIMLHTAGLGFLAGIDIYDCVVVINTQDALDAFSKVRCTLGGEVSAVAGPLGVGGVLESEVHRRQAPIFTYMKSRGLYGGIQVDGTVIIERTDENERFYGERIGVGDILKGKVRHPPFETRKLLETIKSAEGDTNVDESLIPSGPPPGDYEIEDDSAKGFGIPDEEDPDPFGVHALEQAGLEIREAGTKKRPESEQFEFRPSPTSPIYGTFRKSFDRSSIDGKSVSRRSSWRTSAISSIAERAGSPMVDMSTQTDLEAPPAVKAPPPLPPRASHNASPSMGDIPEDKSTDEATAMPTFTPKIAEKEEGEEEKEEMKDSAGLEPEETSKSSPRISKSFDDIDIDLVDAVDDEEPIVVHEIQQASAPQVLNRARIITVAKPVAPKLPQRSPFRSRLTVDSNLANESNRDMATGMSPSLRTPSTPSLGKDEGSTTSSQNSILSVEVPEPVTTTTATLTHLPPKLAHEEEQKKVGDENDRRESFHSIPESPIKSVPGGFI